MIYLLNGPLLNFVSKIGDIIIYSLIAVAIIICIVVMSKYDFTRKALMYVIALIILGGGIYSGFGLYDELTSASYINGSFEYLVKDEEVFEYSSSAMLLSQDSEDDSKYVLDKSLDKVDGFDATKNKYNVTFNNYELINQYKFTAGSLFLEIPLEFFDTDGEQIISFTFFVSIKFLSNNTDFSVYLYGVDENSYFTQYVNDFGFYLLIEKEVN